MYCDQNEAISEQQSGVSAPSHGVVTPKDCLPGFYCPAGTETAHAFPCAIGTYSAATNAEDVNVCTLCTVGMYCPGENITEPAGMCNPGILEESMSYSEKKSTTKINQNR